MQEIRDTTWQLSQQAPVSGHWQTALEEFPTVLQRRVWKITSKGDVWSGA